ncbi:MAG: hypothetical protein J1E83_00630 [Lachnospiraceae bacterium]|nr:hypothetical protein [Lachnospiraceae bacterium]
MTDKGKKQENRSKSCLYLLPERVSAKQLAEVLPSAEGVNYITSRNIEIWTDFNCLELTLKSGILTLEELSAEEMGEADEPLLKKLGMVQIYACDYEESAEGEIRQVMSALKTAFGGILASDTEDFTPFLEVEEL